MTFTLTDYVFFSVTVFCVVYMLGVMVSLFYVHVPAYIIINFIRFIINSVCRGENPAICIHSVHVFGVPFLVHAWAVFFFLAAHGLDFFLAGLPVSAE